MSLTDYTPDFADEQTGTKAGETPAIDKATRKYNEKDVRYIWKHAAKSQKDSIAEARGLTVAQVGRILARLRSNLKAAKEMGELNEKQYEEGISRLKTPRKPQAGRKTAETKALESEFKGIISELVE